MEYEYDSAMEVSYQVSFLKSFKRQIDDCYFSFIIVDAVFDKVAQMEEFWSYAMSKGFQASITTYRLIIYCRFCLHFVGQIYEPIIVWWQEH